MSSETLSFWKVFQYRMSMELPSLMRTLDTMKFAMMMETTMGSSWLMRLIPLKSLFVKVIGGRFCCDSALTKLMSMSRMA